MADSDRLAKKRATTLKDIARATSLSVSTVSRALSQNTSIPEATRQKVIEAAEKLSYRPNAQARALRKSRTDTIGVIIPNIRNPYFAALATAIQTAAREAGVSTILTNSEEDPEILARSLEIMDDQRLDGIIVVPHMQTEEKVTELVGRGVPIVLADRTLGNPDIASVCSDPLPGMTAAVDLYAGTGLKVGYLSGPQDTSTGRERLAAFRDLCAERGIRDTVIYFGGYRQKAGYEGVKELLGQGANAILAGDSMMTIGALLAIHELDLRLGEELQLIGFDNNPAFRLQNPALTIIDQHVEEMGAAAFASLQTIIAGESPEVVQIRIPTTLTINGSTRRCAEADQ
ncbi:LacI family DNA-binding transcriptional regulator [Corynebacterium pacaense]|uniref:LacI family DNA-binding transcriptional regulator n=1 Tax=Corynebacterium pacaense TaxID=1816684 RepID=UPI0009BB5A7E|nr:LacI family DNA-binding transcriptional regulator [Corynebacterium pacaense]